jgi:hypothetical protein
VDEGGGGGGTMLLHLESFVQLRGYHVNDGDQMRHLF